MPSPVHPYSDYGVAMRTLKSARSWLALLLFVCVATQFLGFSLMWWTTQPYEGMRPALNPAPTILDRVMEEAIARLKTTTRPTTAPAVARDDPFSSRPQQERILNVRPQWEAWYTSLVAGTQLASLIAVLSQAIIVFVTLLVMLVSQAPGVAHLTRSLIWSVLLLFMFLPWQYLARDFPIPGVIYGYSELTRMIGRPVAGEHVSAFEMWMIYGRFIGWPLVGLLALLITSERYRAGVMIAIGHPLQSMLQPRGVGLGMTPAVKPRPLAPVGSGDKGMG